MGLRPEHLRLAASGAGTDSAYRLPAVLEAIELLGNEVIVMARSGEQEVVVRMAPQALPEPGSGITFEYTASSLHYFRADTGERLG